MVAVNEVKKPEVEEPPASMLLGEVLVLADRSHKRLHELIEMGAPQKIIDREVGIQVKLLLGVPGLYSKYREECDIS